MKRLITLLCLLFLSLILMVFDRLWTDEKSMKGTYSTADGKIRIYFAEGEKVEGVHKGEKFLRTDYNAAMTFYGDTDNYSYLKDGNALYLWEEGSLDGGPVIKTRFSILDGRKIRLDSYEMTIIYAYDVSTGKRRPPEESEGKDLNIILHKR